MNIFQVLVVFFIACWFGMSMAENKQRLVKEHYCEWDGSERRCGEERRKKITHRSEPNGRLVETPSDRRKR